MQQLQQLQQVQQVQPEQQVQPSPDGESVMSSDAPRLTVLSRPSMQSSDAIIAILISLCSAHSDHSQAPISQPGGLVCMAQLSQPTRELMTQESKLGNPCLMFGFCSSQVALPSALRRDSRTVMERLSRQH